MLERLFAKAAVLTLTAALMASSVALAQPAPPSGNPTPCNPGTCTLTITVKGDCRQPGNISIDKPFVSTSSAINMRWTIATAGHEFTADGIRFDPPNPQFEPRNSPKPNEFHIHNKKSSNGNFYYFVNLKGCAPLDPWVHNTN
jgi:hypothetical protein